MDKCPADRDKTVIERRPARTAACQGTPRRMLIVTSNAVTPTLDRTPLLVWPGPHVLVIRPGSGWSRSAIAGAQPAMTVIEYLQPQGRTVDLLRDALAAMRRTVQPITGALLYLDAPPVGPLMPQSQMARARRFPHAVEADAAGGGLTRLLLGEMVATSPLLPRLIDHLAARGVDDDRFADALHTPFLQAPA